ncbi:MAG: peptidyl-prolyl cis-trans isomerase [bacterium]|nr:peptidyl-prolyl cis-trans isomerase [bacterium]
MVTATLRSLFRRYRPGAILPVWTLPVWTLAVWAFLLAATTTWSGCDSSDPVVAEVAGQPISAAELRAFVEKLPDGLKSTYEGDAARQQYVQSLVDRRLMLLEAHVLGLDTTRAVTRALNNATRGYLATRYQREVVVRDVQIDKAEIERRVVERGYDRDRKLHAILVHTRAEIDAVVAALKAGVSFADVAREYSLDERSAVQGGELGFVDIEAAERLHVPRQVFRELPSGETSAPLAAGASWHVVQFVEDRPAAMSRVRSQLEEDLYAEGVGQAEEEKMELLRAKFDVVLHEQGLTQIVDAYRLRNTADLELSNDLLFSFGTEQVTVGEAQQSIRRGAPTAALAEREGAIAVLNQRVLTPGLYAYAALDEGVVNEAELQQYRRQLAEDMLLETIRRQETESIDVSDIEIRQFYDDFPEQFVHERSVWAEELLLGTEAEAHQIRRLVEEGADLAEFVGQSLRADAKKRGARHHYHPLEVALYPRLVPALLAAEKGVLMGPLEVDGGWSVFRVAHVDEGGIEPFDTVQRRARALLLRRRQQSAFGAFLQHLRDTHAAVVTIHAERLQEALPVEVL